MKRQIELHIPLSRGRRAVLGFAYPLSKENYEYIKKWLESLRPSLVFPVNEIEEKNYVDIYRAIQASGYNRQYIYRLIHLRQITAIKKGHQYWIDLESLRAYKQKMDTKRTIQK